MRAYNWSFSQPSLQPQKVILFYKGIHIKDFMHCQHILIIVCLHSLNYLLSATEILKLHFPFSVKKLCSLTGEYSVFPEHFVLSKETERGN